MGGELKERGGLVFLPEGIDQIRLSCSELAQINLTFRFEEIERQAEGPLVRLQNVVVHRNVDVLGIRVDLVLREQRLVKELNGNARRLGWSP